MPPLITTNIYMQLYKTLVRTQTQVLADNIAIASPRPGVSKLRPVDHKWPISKFLVAHLPLTKIRTLQYLYIAQQKIRIITEYELLGYKTIHTSIIR